jgi:hypothetical protein
MNPKNVNLLLDAESALQLVEDASRFVERIREYLTDEGILGVAREGSN